jgi:hypothetical protein
MEGKDGKGGDAERVWRSRSHKQDLGPLCNAAAAGKDWATSCIPTTTTSTRTRAHMQPT